MSHQPERKEKNCLNCGTTVMGRYCQQCGQENIITHQSFGSMVRHFIFDIFHFDGKFFDTLRYLLFRPGFVPRQYIEGKRISYLDPIRMYLFTSAIFFLVFFSLDDVKVVRFDGTYMTKAERLDYAAALRKQPASAEQAKLLNYLLDTSFHLELKDASRQKATDSSFKITLNGQQLILTPGTKHIFDDSLNTNIGFLDREWKRKKHKLIEQGDDFQSFVMSLSNQFLHRMPYLFFISLPFFAFFLKLLYLKRKQLVYSDHAVFTLYHYIFCFILFLFITLLTELNNLLKWSMINLLALGMIVWMAYYLFRSMHKFYGQGVLKTVFKFILLNILAGLMLLLLFLIFLIFSFLQ